MLSGPMKSPSCPVDRRAGCPVARAQIRQVAAVISDRTHIRPSNYQARRPCPGRWSKYSRLDCEPSKLAVGEPQGHPGSLRPIAGGRGSKGAALQLRCSGRTKGGKSSAQAKRTFGRWRANKAKYSLQILVDFEHFLDIQLHLYLADAPAEKAMLLKFL